jgi:hypothetical protein
MLMGILEKMASVSTKNLSRMIKGQISKKSMRLTLSLDPSRSILIKLTSSSLVIYIQFFNHFKPVFLIDLSRSSFLFLGPATNLAAVIMKCPEVK